MAFQHIRTGDLANLPNPIAGDAPIPVKVLQIFPNPQGGTPVAHVKVTAGRTDFPKGYSLLADARRLISRTPSKGISIPVWREEN